MRLTKRDRGGNAVMDCDNCEIKYRESCCSLYLCRNALIKKLAAYEDAGLTPEDILCIRATQRITPERLAEIVRAEIKGRLVILPCKVGDTVYYLSPCDEIENGKITMIQQKADGTWKFRVTTDFSHDVTTDAIGKTVFLARAEAEAALKGEKT